MSNGSSHPDLDRWHRIVFQRDAQDLQAMLAEDVVFHSPYLAEPYAGRQATALILTAVGEVLQDFTYHREIIEGNNWALEFSARVGRPILEGNRPDSAGRRRPDRRIRGLCPAVQRPAGPRRGDGPAAEQRVLK